MGVHGGAPWTVMADVPCTAPLRRGRVDLFMILAIRAESGGTATAEAPRRRCNVVRRRSGMRLQQMHGTVAWRRATGPLRRGRGSCT